jgi:hypothetical protein
MFSLCLYGTEDLLRDSLEKDMFTWHLLTGNIILFNYSSGFAENEVNFYRQSHHFTLN